MKPKKPKPYIICVGTVSIDRPEMDNFIRIVDEKERTIWTIDVQLDGSLKIRLANPDPKRGFNHCGMLIEPHVTNTITLKQQA